MAASADHERDLAALDGCGPANIFDLEDVYGAEALEAEAPEEPTAAVVPEAKRPPEPDDGYDPDADMPPPGGILLRYGGGEELPGLPTRAEIVAERSSRLSAALEPKLAEGKPVFFMPTAIEELNEYGRGHPAYVLRAYGVLMDGSKTEVVVTDIEVFFDVRVPSGAPSVSVPAGAAAAPAPWRPPAPVSAAAVASFDAHLRQLLAEAGVAGARVRDHEAYPLREYREDGVYAPFKRVHLPNLQERRKAIAAVREAGFETASDDRSCYFRKAARELDLPLSDWAILSNYEHEEGPTERSPLCAHVFRVAVAGYRPFCSQMGDPAKSAAENKAAREKAAGVRARTPALERDRTLEVGWDIETWSGRRTGEVPNAAFEEDNAFTICFSAHWKDDPAPLREVCLVDVETAPTAGRTTVVCGSPANVLRAFALVWRALAPDIFAGFNDGQYDWPFLVVKAQKLGVLAWMFEKMTAAPRRGQTEEAVLRWNYRGPPHSPPQKIKISPEETYLCSYLSVPGCVMLDVRAAFKKLYPKSEAPKSSSLKFYLEACGLPGKADMPIPRMNRYYEAALETEGEPDAAAAEGMRAVLHYCTIDARRCPQLLIKRNVVNDLREVASIAFVSLADAHYYAGGMKVCNLLGAYATRRSLLMSMIALERTETGKYPGAYVFPPEKGLVPDPGHLAAIDAAAAALRTVVGAAAVVNLARAEGVRQNAANAVKVAGEEAKLGAEVTLAEAEAALQREVAAVAAEAKADSGRVAELQLALVAAFREFAADRPVTGLDFSSLYPSIIMTYNLSPEKILLHQAEADYWAARGRDLHRIEFQFNGRDVLAWSVRHGNVAKEIGLFPTVLIDLFNRRAEVKVVLGRHAAVKELIEGVQAAAKKDGVRVAEAARAALADAEAEVARTAAALAPGAPPPRISPGATLGEELAELKRLGKNAAEQVAILQKVVAAAEARAAADADAALEAEIASVYDRAMFDWVCANSKQNAIKVFMNSFYGETGNSLSPVFLLPLAGGVTEAGRSSIQAVDRFVRGRVFRSKYGDSVAGDTALVVRHGGVVRTARIDELVPDAGWAPYHGDKEAAVIPGLEVWSDTGFTVVNRIIRHTYSGTIWRILTHTGIVDCTEDHSLLQPDGAAIRPSETNVGEPLLHANDCQLLRCLDVVAATGITPDEAWVMGLFAAEGTAAVYDRSCGSKLYRWVIVNQDKALLDLAAERCPFRTKVFGPYAKGMYQLLPVRHHKAPTLKYRSLFYNAAGEKRIPTEILAAEFDIAHEFWLGFYEGDGYKTDPARRTRLAIGQRGKEMTTGLWLLARRLGWDISLNTREAHPNIFTIIMTDGVSRQKKPPLAIKKKIESQVKGMAVYDLETESHHFHVGPGNLTVHNTDSLYLQPPNECFAECDAEYAAAKLSREEWYAAQVRITMRALNAIRDEVNAFLKAGNGSPYLKMAYEEVLYPVVFTGKKRYFGIPHLNEVNFRPKKLFIRGIDVVKQGQPGLARTIGHRIMWACMALDNTRSIRRISEDVLGDAVTNGGQWRFDDFIKSDAWKPHKNNIPVHRCIDRMRVRHDAEEAENRALVAAGRPARPVLYAMPEAGERFSYVIVKTGAAFDLRGHKSTLKKGDRMVFAGAARALGLEVDVAFYMVSYVVGLCARFINSDPEFRVEPTAIMTDKKADEESQKKAKRALEAYIKSLNNVDSAAVRKRGYAYRRAYSGAAGAARAGLAAAAGPGAAAVLHGEWLDFELFGADEGDEEEAAADPAAAAARVADAVWAAAGRLADAVTARDGDTYCAALARARGIGPGGADVADAAVTPPARPAARPAANLWGVAAPARRRPATACGLDQAEAAVRRRLAALLPAVGQIAGRYGAALEYLVLRHRADEHRARPEIGAAEADVAEAGTAAASPVADLFTIGDADRATLLEFRRAWFDAAGIRIVRARDAQYEAYIRQLKAKRTGAPAAPPPRAARPALIAAAAAKLRPIGVAE